VLITADSESSRAAVTGGELFRFIWFNDILVFGPRDICAVDEMSA
jgi:hypothetical protein